MPREAEKELKTMLQALDEKRSPQTGAHATIELLQAYHRGQLPAPESEQLAEHLTWCQECLDTLLEWAAFAEEDGESLPPTAELAAWASMQARIEPETRTTLPPAERPVVGGRFVSTWIPYALAASFLIISVALGLWVVSLRRQTGGVSAQLQEQLTRREQEITTLTHQLEQTRQQLDETSRRTDEQIAGLRRQVDELAQPQINVPIGELQPYVRRSDEGTTVPTVVVPPHAGVIALLLYVDDESPYRAYALELLNQQGQNIWSGQGLEKTADDTVTLVLPRQLCPAGQYTVQLYGLRAGQKKLVQEYRVQITYR